MTIPIETTGVILAGAQTGWFVRVRDDSQSTGGFLVVVGKNLDSNGKVEGYDDWVQDEAALEQYWKECRWLIEWGAPGEMTGVGNSIKL